MPRSHRGRLDIDLAGIDDLVLVGGRALDRFPFGFLDLAQLELDLLAEGADFDCRGLGLVADAARLHLVDAGLDADRKSTRLNSSHEWISYAVFCLKKKKNFIRMQFITINKKKLR